ERRAAQHGDARAHERRRERRQQRDVVGVEDALGEAERKRGDEERAADRDHPAAARVRTTQPAGYDDAETADEREAEQPPGLSAERLVQQPERPGRAAERTAAAERLRPAGLPVEAAEAVVAEDQRPDAVV